MKNYIGLVVTACIVPGIAFAGLTEAQRKSQLEKALGIIVAAATPQKPADHRDKMIKEYIDAKSSKGFAIEPVNGD
jgi:ribosomal protein S7